MPTAEIGPAGRLVADNIRKLRGHMSLRELESRLRESGRPILASGLFKIEHNTRRIDIDDLAALAGVFGVTPGQLFDPDGLGDVLSAVDVEKHRDLFDAALRAVLALKAKGLPLRGVIDYLQYDASNKQLLPSGAVLTAETHVVYTEDDSRQEQEWIDRRRQERSDGQR
jgi:transcriptional regulator with XRE-family HTH domain